MDQLASVVLWFASLILAPCSLGQSLAPRAYTITPVESNAVTVTGNVYTGAILFDPSVPITGASGSIGIFLPTNYHGFSSLVVPPNHWRYPLFGWDIQRHGRRP